MIKILFVQKNGIKKNHAKKVPNILQAVESAYRFHIVVQQLVIFLILSFATYGEIIQSKTLAGENNIIDDITELIFKLSVIHDIVFNIRYFDIRVRVMKIPENNIINDNHSNEALLSAIFHHK